MAEKMENTELVSRIEAEKTKKQNRNGDEQEMTLKLLVVDIHKKKYAFYADQIKEIVANVPVYFVPFVPSYIRGVINRHGEPYTVFDLHALFEHEDLESATFLISNFRNDQVAFLVSSVVEIQKIPESALHIITAIDDHDSFFLGSVSSKGEEIFLLNLPNILDRLAHDLE